MARGPRMIEAICPGCFKSFTKIGSMHRHIYEDRCQNPIPRFVKKIKAEHSARVAAAAARSAARAAARAAGPTPPTTHTNAHTHAHTQTLAAAALGQQQSDTKGDPAQDPLGKGQWLVPARTCCGLVFAHEGSLEQHRTGGYCEAVQRQCWEPVDFGFSQINALNANWVAAFQDPWKQGWPQMQV